MITSKLEETWEKATEEARINAIIQSKKILGNLIHYPKSFRNHYHDDVMMLAMELLDWRGVY